ncbi:MAG: ABC transporter permease [Deltaproteobacteria bacterium]|nr:ABC transporter permease [Deltaproteobacteria bacterium]
MLRYSFLFEQMCRRELRQKYRGSALGVVWYFINPLVLMGVYALVFSVMLKVIDIPDYPLFLILGLIVWVFFAQSVVAAAPSLVQNDRLIRKVQFPRETIPAAATTVQFATFLIMLAIVLPVALLVRGSLDPALLLLIPVVAALFAFVLGATLAASVLHAHYRDVEPVLATALLPWFFITPIFFQTEKLPGASEYPLIADALTWGNPIAPFVGSLREILYAGAMPSLAQLVYVIAAGAIALTLGSLLFRRMQRDLAVIL